MDVIQMYGSPYGYGMIPDSQDLSLVEQTNPDKILEDIEMTLRGRIYSQDRKEWTQPIGSKPLINESGLNSLMADARGLINQNTILSNLNDEQIGKLIITVGRAIKNKIKMNWKEFGIDKSNLTTCILAITNPAYAALMRAKNEGEKRFLKTSVRAVETYATNAKPMQDQSYATSDKLKFWR
jgi:hypothetical protein